MLGFGIENQALIEFLLKKKINCEITVCDARKKYCGNAPPLAPLFAKGGVARGGAFPRKNIKWRLGKNYDANLDKFDIVFRVAGYPLFSTEIRKAKKAGVEISSPTKLFFELCPTKNIIGVTGTKGKGTTVSLVYAILKKEFGNRHSPLSGDCDAAKRGDFNVWIGGNIGIPMFSFTDKIKKNDWVVLELSSFQLEDMTVSPKIAVITNFYKEHLAPADPNNPNYHKTLRDYWDAKLNIIRWQKRGDYAILNNNLKATPPFVIAFGETPPSPLARPRRRRWQNAVAKSGVAFKGRKIFFIQSNLASKLIGNHNKENIAAAVKAAKIVGVKNGIIKKAVASFKGLEHRLEYVRIIKGVKYYNDSFATTPESAITALKSFNDPIILLAGGADKGSNFKQFAKEIKKRVKFVVLLNGKATPKIKKELLKIKYPKNIIKLVNSIKDAVKTACENADKGDIVLLSPACASFGMFKNYKERGMMFKQEVERLK